MLNTSGETVNLDVLRDMTRALQHRGPDGEGIWVDGNVGLGHRRLTIIDLSENGRQPMTNETGKIWVTYNGEIYNFRELRNELISKGHVFTSTTDTEVIVHLYEEEGLDCVKRLSGMFAFALWDADKRRLLLARDRLGMKPLFYHFAGGKIRFGSEIKALLADPGIERRIDDQGLHNFLSLNYTTAPLTLFDGVRQLLPAHAICLENGEMREWRYWDIHFPDEYQNRTEQEWLEQFQEILGESVSSHLIADVPFGALLSGGLDSSAMVALMAERLNFSVQTFSIGFKEDSYNEIDYARLVAKKYRTEHMESIIEPKMIDVLPRLVWHSEEPLADPSSIPMYYLAAMVSKKVKMVVGGDGADELLAGYETYQADYYARAYRKMPRFLTKGLIEPLVNRLPVSYERYSFEMKLKRFVRAANLSPEEAHFSWRMIFDESSKDALKCAGDVCEPTFNMYKSLFDRVPSDQFLNRMLYFDTCFHLPNDIMNKVDRMSMAHGLEVRVPFLDPKVVEFMAQLPSALKLKRLRTKKYLLKQAMRSYLPAEILHRPKAGFNVPLGSWLRADLREFMCDLLSPGNLRKQGLLDEKVVQRLVDEHLKGRKDNSFELWGLLVLMVWWQLFFSREISVSPRS